MRSERCVFVHLICKVPTSRGACLSMEAAHVFASTTARLVTCAGGLETQRRAREHGELCAGLQAGVPAASEMHGKRQCMGCTCCVLSGCCESPHM